MLVKGATALKYSLETILSSVETFCRWRVDAKSTWVSWESFLMFLADFLRGFLFNCTLFFFLAASCCVFFFSLAFFFASRCIAANRFLVSRCLISSDISLLLWRVFVSLAAPWVKYGTHLPIFWGWDQTALKDGHWCHCQSDLVVQLFRLPPAS